MEGGDVWNMFKTANRKVIKHVAPALFGSLGTIAPLVIGQPELIPPALAVAGVANELSKASLPIYGKNKKRYEKLNRQEEEDRQFKKSVEMAKTIQAQQPPKPTYYTSPYQTTSPYNNISPNNNMPYNRTYTHSSTGRGLHAPRSRGTGYDSISYMSKASLGHAQANSMLGKLESHMAQARQHNQGIVGVSGNLINQIAPLQSQPQQNFQFRHTLITPAYRPTVFGNA